MTALASVVIPCYNAEAFIAQTIDSVLSQGEENWEMLVVDDCSTDDSKAIISSYTEKDKRIKLIALAKNLGVSQARNVGIQRATGRYIAFLDSDDLWLPNKLEKQLKFMGDKHLAFSYASYKLMDGLGHHFGVFTTKSTLSYVDLLKTCSIGCLTAIYDTQELGKLYFPSINKCEDYALWLKILKQIKTAQGILEPLAVYRAHNHSLSSNKISSAIYQWRIYREFEHLNWLISCYYFCHYGYYGLTKYRLRNLWRSVFEKRRDF